MTSLSRLDDNGVVDHYFSPLPKRCTRVARNVSILKSMTRKTSINNISCIGGSVGQVKLRKSYSYKTFVLMLLDDFENEKENRAF